jgi:Protein of unknown function (DUF4058)
MAYRFPGMDPWLEDSKIWRDVHNRLVNSIGDELADQLTPRYFIGVDSHTYTSRFPDQPIVTRYPDVAIIDLGGAAAIQPLPATTMTGYLEVDLPVREMLEETFPEIRLVPNGEIVTVIELLTHIKKQAGPERESYLEKRSAYLAEDLNFVEIDLLRAYTPMPHTERVGKNQYRIFIHRKTRPYQAHLYHFGVRQAIPQIPIPLQPGEQEPLVDLGALLRRVYERVRYDLVIDYRQPPTPALDKTGLTWAQEQPATR